MWDNWKRKEIFFVLILILAIVVYSFVQSKKHVFRKKKLHLTENTENAALIRQQAEEILGTIVNRAKSISNVYCNARGTDRRHNCYYSR